LTMHVIVFPFSGINFFIRPSVSTKTIYLILMPISFVD
jgi:hypothetical protein